MNRRYLLIWEGLSIYNYKLSAKQKKTLNSVFLTLEQYRCLCDIYIEKQFDRSVSQIVFQAGVQAGVGGACINRLVLLRPHNRLHRKIGRAPREHEVKPNLSKGENLPAISATSHHTSTYSSPVFAQLPTVRLT